VPGVGKRPARERMIRVEFPVCVTKDCNQISTTAVGEGNVPIGPPSALATGVGHRQQGAGGTMVGD
jgi:hypothetical protein